MPVKLLTLTPLTDLDKARIQRLAGDMRVGAKIRPQCQDRLWGKIDGNGFGSCAFGAAWEAAHPDFDLMAWWESTSKLDINEVVNDYQIGKIAAVHPAHFVNSVPPVHYLDDIITNLNDVRNWTREAIADWLISLTQ